MKNMIVGALVGALAATAIIEITGCKSGQVPTPAQIEDIAYFAGVASAKVCNMLNIDTDTRNGVVEVINEVKVRIPQVGQTIAEVWIPFAEEYVTKQITKGRWTVAEGKLILEVFSVACDGIDYFFRVRWPQVSQITDLVEAGIHGFTNGFLEYFKPVNGLQAPAGKFDKETYNYLLIKTNVKL